MRVALLAATLAMCAALLFACGGSGHASSRGASADPPSHARSSGRLPDLQDAACADWRHADRIHRLVLLRELKASREQPVTGSGMQGGGSVLSDQQAQHLLDALCSRRHFEAMRLYRVYALASDFVGTAP